MIFIYDKLIATLIATSVMVIFFAIQHRTTEVNIDQTMTYSARTQTIELGRWIRQDLLNVGAGMGGGPVTFLGPTTGIAGGNTADNGSGLIFEYAKMVGGSSVTVSYTIEDVMEGGAPKTAIVAGDTLNIYKLVRRANGVVKGESIDALTYFEINSLSADGNKRNNVSTWPAGDDPSSISFSFSMLKPSYTERQYIPETHWGTTVPIN